MPPKLDIVLPIRIQRFEQTSLPKTTLAHDHAEGFATGHEEGRLRAEWSAQQQRERDREKVRALTAKLENLHLEYEKLLEEHLPDLIHGALSRVFRKHAFTAQEIGAEVSLLLRDMEQAGRIVLECAPAEEEALRRNLEECESIPNNSKWTLLPNEALASGEFILKSDLGNVDGRHSSRLRQIHMVLEPSA